MENEMGLPAFRRLIEQGAVHYVQFDPIVGGGITEARKIAALAEAFFLPVTLHHSNSIVSMATNLHVAAAMPNCDSVEFHVLHQPLFDRAPPGFLDLQDGHLLVPETPGLGVDLSHILA
jgi:L-alanine-DL-glutamate epimerase-like enolase superfamily enzyme